MYVVTVEPLTAAGPIVLTYIANENFPPGSIVPITLRNRSELGYVTNSESASNARFTLRKATYKTKKIIAKAVTSLADWHDILSTTSLQMGTSRGRLLNLVLTKGDREALATDLFTSVSPPLTSPHTTVMCGTADDRLDRYRDLVRSHVKAGAIIMLTPTTEQAKVLRETMVTSDYFADLLSTKKKRLFIGTTKQLARLFDTPVSLIIVHQESSQLYWNQQAAWCHVPTLARYLHQGPTILADTIPQMSTLIQAEKGVWHKDRLYHTRLPYHAKRLIVDMSKKSEHAHSEFIGLSTKAALDTATSKGEKVLVYVHKRGLASSISCAVCGADQLCTNCKAVVALHEVGGKRLGLCHRCGQKQDITPCTRCGNDQLTTHGITSDTVAKELSQLYPDVPVIRADKDTVTTDTARRTTVRRFYKTTGPAILVARHSTLRFLHQAVPVSVIASLDTFFHLPEWNADEQILQLLYAVESLTHDTLYIQTRQREQEFFRLMKQRDLKAFISNEVTLRQAAEFPPLARLIRIEMLSPTAPLAKKYAQFVAKMCEEYEPLVYPSLYPSGEVRSWFVLLRLNIDDPWPLPVMPELIAMIPSVEILVDSPRLFG